MQPLLRHFQPNCITRIDGVFTISGVIEVVSNVDLDVNEHKLVEFLGSSGCGKSTILRMFAGLEDVNSGELYIAEKLINDTDPMDHGIATLIQHYALYPHLDNMDNITFGLRRMKVSEADIVGYACL